MKIIIILIVLMIICYVYLTIHDYCNNPKIHIFKSHVKGKTIVLLGGTHGNEPAGAIYLNNLINNLNNRKIILKKGTLIIIPMVNHCGIGLNSRTVPGIIPWDINRHYDTNHDNLPHLISQYIYWIDNSDLIIDLHEGWGYYHKDTESIGSGVYAFGDESTLKIGKTMVNAINNTIKNPLYKFGSKLKTHIDYSLDDYCKQKNKNYILIEVSGQDDIQPLNMRIDQFELLVNVALFLFQNSFGL